MDLDAIRRQIHLEAARLRDELCPLCGDATRDTGSYIRCTSCGWSITHGCICEIYALDLENNMIYGILAGEGQETICMNISPALAGRLLATSVGNRKLRPTHVKALAAAMQRGEWILTHQGVAIDESGALRDGHHRLTACVQSGVTVQMQVTYGVAENAYDCIDQGAKRSVSDILRMDARIAQPLRLGAEFAFNRQAVSIVEVRRVAEGGLLSVLQEMTKYCGHTQKVTSSAPMKLAAAISIMSGLDRAFVLGQYRAINVLDYDRQSNIAKVLCRQVANGTARTKPASECVARALRVFNPELANATHLKLSDQEASAAVLHVRTTLLMSMADKQENQG